MIRSSAVLLAIVLVAATTLRADTVPVRFPEGLVHGFLALRTLDGKTVADGDLLQVARGNRVTSRLVFRFKDGSIQDETTVFTQSRVFRFVSSRLIQKGPTFPRPIDLSIEQGGKVTLRSKHHNGEEYEKTDQMELPEDLSNGTIFTLLKNVRADTPPIKLSLLVATPKPLVVKLDIERFAKETFLVGRSRRTATRYVVKVDIPGVKGVLADLLGKAPPDSYVWVLHGEAPAFVMSQSPFFMEGPMWRIELVGPTWPAARAASAAR